MGAAASSRQRPERAHRGQGPDCTASSSGALGGYIGMKQEERGDFSLGLGESKASKLLFQHFIKRVEIIE